MRMADGSQSANPHLCQSIIKQLILLHPKSRQFALKLISPSDQANPIQFKSIQFNPHTSETRFRSRISSPARSSHIKHAANQKSALVNGLEKLPAH